MDLAALNIQRGRDHGLAAYNIWREQCGLRRFQDWSDMKDVMSATTVNRLASVYDHVDDVDLFTGGLSERPVVGGVVGPTFACILGQQFLNLRRGDRFWYENSKDKNPGSFTPDQLQEIRKSSLSRIICNNLDDVTMIQPYAFLADDDFTNRRKSCRGPAIPKIDLKKWKESPERPSQFSSAENLFSLYMQNVPDVNDVKVDLEDLELDREDDEEQGQNHADVEQWRTNKEEAVVKAFSSDNVPVADETPQPLDEGRYLQALGNMNHQDLDISASQSSTGPNNFEFDSFLNDLESL